MKVLAFAGSLRAASYNRRLLALVVARARAHGADVDELDLRDVAMPLYDGDLEEASGLPAGAQTFRERIRAADALAIASPEYNGSIPGTLKNAIDWASRPPDPPFRGKTVLVVSASTGVVGGARGLGEWRKIFGAIGAVVAPGQLSLGRAADQFDEHGALKDAAIAKQLDTLVHGFVALATKLAR